ncbi:multidrug effflux MFS transporter [Actinopolyspora mortivallis]|uniref:Bcr/CflA family drug resistance efflux transporter n=1 Tax=Actinopolyspora mortivallis TaxID=33906 RepID=A0A2T0GY14_ACTMO|nr:multidrug effflux MFS transporter [Actinopolyspora mortivallis]PRW64005.1 Bcr/CflA family drug resistance efflux transporter [Actinopolyspora mortivallis]
MEKLAEHSTSTSTSARTSEPTGWARARIILVLGALVALVPLTIDMYLPALPAIGDSLNAGSSATQLTLTGTLLGLGLGQLAIGPFSDAAGRRLPLILGISLHVVASLLCLVAPNIVLLGLLRVLQGVGGASAMVVALASVSDLFTGRTAATTLSRLMLVNGAAPILAPTLGGIILLRLSWRGVFAVLAGLGAVLLVLAVLALRESLPPERRHRGGMRPVLVSYRRLLTDGQFMVMILVAALGMSALFSYISGASFVLQEQFGLNQQQFGLVFGLGALTIIAATQFNVVLLRRLAPRQIVFGALATATAAGAVLTTVSVFALGGLVGFFVPLLFMLGAVGFVLPNAPALALERHGDSGGTAAALLGAVQFGLGAFMAPIVGVLGNDGPAMAVTMTGGVLIALVALSVMTGRKPAHG